MKSAHIGFTKMFRETADIAHVPLPVGLPVERIGSRLAIRPAYRQDGRGE